MASTEPRLGKDFLAIPDLTHAALEQLLGLAAQMKVDRRMGRRAPTADVLGGRHVALLFEKPSLRTWCTFEVAVHELGGHTVHLPAQFGEGVREPLQDVARNLERWIAALVIRTYRQETAAALADAAPRLHVINALSDEHHPCQALADVLTLRERWGTLRGRTLTYVGDGNNVATSLAQAAIMMGVHVRVATPAGYELPPPIVAELSALAREGATLQLFTDPRQAVAGADAVYTDVWTSMGQEREAVKRRGVFAQFQVNAGLMAAAAPGAWFMHCLPAHRGEEVTTDVLESAASVIFDQAENRLHTQKALLAMLIAP